MALGLLAPQFSLYESNQTTPSDTPGTSIANPAGGANTKDTTWTTLVASLAFDVAMIGVHFSGSAVSATNTATLIDLGIGAAAAEEIVIPDLLAGWVPAGSTIGGFKSYYFPLYLPAGSRLSARAASVRTTGSVRCAVELWGGPRNPDAWVGQQVIAYGIDAANSRGTAVTAGASSAEGSWTEITSGTSQDHAAIVAAIGGATATTTMVNGTYLMDVGVGAATEAAIFENLRAREDTAEQVCQQQPWLPIYVPVPSGTRLVARLSSNSAGPVVNDCALYGVS